MKLKKTLLLALVAASIAITSCTKDHLATAAKKVSKFYNTAAPTESMTFSYDNSGRLKSQVGKFMTAQFDYSGNGFAATLKDENAVTYFTFTGGILDGAGRLTEVTGTYTPVGGPNYTYKYQFTYNAEGYLAKFINTNITTGHYSTENYTYVDGNMVKDECTFDGQPNYITDYEYYTNVANNWNIDLLPQILGFYTGGLTGKHSKNLVKSEKNHDNQNVLNIDYTFQYQFDSEGYPSSYLLTSLINNSTYNRALEYSK